MELKSNTIKLFFFNYVVWLSSSTTAADSLNVNLSNDTVYDSKGELIRAIASGSIKAVEQCQRQFKWERWNCPQSAFTRKSQQPATREMAFVSAVTAAGIVHAVTRGCSSGDIRSCGCRDDPRGNSTAETWSWGGCSDDVQFGDMVSDTFLTSLEEGTANVESSRHNSRLGRFIVRQSVLPECKCHGLSGSCTTKTCWKKIAPFSHIGDALKKKYLNAQRVQLNAANRLSKFEVSQGQMVFLDESPDYCKVNKTSEWPGTGGRVCSRNFRAGDPSEKRSCRELCRSCGHQVKRKPVKITWKCNCKFRWCCEVSCSKCEKTLVQHYCDESPQTFKS